MNRTRQITDFTVTVEDVGVFTFAKRRMIDELKIQAEYAKIIDGATPTDWLATLAGWKATLDVLTVAGPAGWNIDEMDPLDPAVYAKIKRVYDALTEKERSFRLQSSEAGKSRGAGAE